LRGKAGLPESWPWIKAEVGDAEGAVVPFTAVAGSDVNVLIFSVDTFERLVGAASDIFLSPVFSLKKAALIRQENNDIIALNCQKFDVANFTIKYILGCGSFGCVAFAEYTEPRQQAKRPSLRNSFSNFMSAAAGGNVSQRQEPKPVVEKISSYALKLFSKSEIVRTRQVDQIITEKKLLSMLRNRFILRVYGTAQSSNHLYIVTEVLDCGDLWELIYLKNPSPHQGLPLELTRFYAASIILGLGYIHEKGLAHRDIKPENIMLDKKGYLRIIDFGFCKMIPFTTTSPTGQERIHAKSFTLCGTPGKTLIMHAFHTLNRLSSCCH
jgi:serine/threonine protein kinase